MRVRRTDNNDEIPLVWTQKVGRGFIPAINEYRADSEKSSHTADAKTVGLHQSKIRTHTVNRKE